MRADDTGFHPSPSAPPAPARTRTQNSAPRSSPAAAKVFHAPATNPQAGRHPTFPPMKRLQLSEPVRLALKYLLIAGLWIVVSDRVLALFFGGGPSTEFWSIAKGLGFVVVTAGILHALARRMQSRIREADSSRQTELRQVNERLQRAKGFLAALARANQAAATARDEKALCQAIAEALVGLAGMRFVWFAWVNESTGCIEPAVWAGDGAECIQHLVCTVHPEDRLGRGPTGRALREGRVITCHSIERDPAMEPWRQALLACGFRSSASAPICVGERRGAVCAYASKEEFFDEELIELTGRLVADLEHGLELLAARAEKERLDTRLRLMQTAIEAAPSGILIADAQGRIEWANPAFTTMTGYALDEIAGRNPSLLKSGRQDPDFYAALWKTITHGEIWSGELQNQRRDGTLYWERMIIAPVVIGGRIEHFVAIKQDISAEKAMERQVARTQRLESIGLLAGGIAHDLNNVLAPILLAIDILKLGRPNPTDRERLEMIRAAAERGAGIVRQVLTFARGVEGERMNLPVEHVVKEVRNLLRETLPRLIELRCEIEPDLPMIRGDATQLHQVLLNLAVNARDAMVRGGTLRLGAGRVRLPEPLITQSGLTIPAGDYVGISVSDTGEGIAPEALEHIFEPFYTTKPRGAGTGLGLSTVLGIVRGHGGGLDVTSRPGRGTEFRVLLPAAAEDAPPAPPAAAELEVEGRGREILVVDDEDSIREVAGLVLTNHGFTPVEACDGRAALDLFEKEPARFTAVILDRLMPRIGGDVVAARIKELRPDLPVILISGVLDTGPPPGAPPGPAELYRKNGDTVLQKPFSQRELIAALARVLPPTAA